MSEQDDPRLAIVVAGRSVGANLDRAIMAGAVVRNGDGGLALAKDDESTDTISGNSKFIKKYGKYHPPCSFLNNFLFKRVYARSAVPIGCRNCYKIKVSSSSLRQLMKMKDIAEASGNSTKSGEEVSNPSNSEPYNTYLYFDGLDAARRAYAGLRESVDQEQVLGAGVAMTIKRGCSNYERDCGPSDQYSFDPKLEDVEAYLHSRFVESDSPSLEPQIDDAARVLQLIRVAFRIGDETYKDFTAGKPLYPPLVSYSPEPEDSAASRRRPA